MNVRLRVLVAVAATAVLGTMGAVAAVPASASVVPPSASAVPASASVAAITGGICSEDAVGNCLKSPSAPNVVYVGSIANYYVTDCSAGMTYNGEDYCEVKESGTNTCLQFNASDINVNGKEVDNLVTAASCNSNRISQDWWWSGVRFRNLYATQLGQGPCMNLDTTTDYVDVYSCSFDSSKWSF